MTEDILTNDELDVIEADVHHGLALGDCARLFTSHRAQAARIEELESTKFHTGAQVFDHFIPGWRKSCEHCYCQRVEATTGASEGVRCCRCSNVRHTGVML